VDEGWARDGCLTAFLAESVVPNLALYELGLLFLLATPALVFRFVVTNLGGSAD